MMQILEENKWALTVLARRKWELKISKAATRKASHVGDEGDTTGQVMWQELLFL